MLGVRVLGEGQVGVEALLVLAAAACEVSSQSFNQLVYYQSTVVQSLKTHLQVKGSLAYQPLLE